MPSPEETRAQVLLAETREEITRADGKATTLLGVAGLILGALLAGMIAGDWSPGLLCDRVEWIFWVGAGCALLGEAALCAAVMPSLRHDQEPGGLRYFEHVAQYKTREAFSEALSRVGADHLRTVDQVWVLSRIAHRKYRLIAAGMLLLGVGAVLCLGAVIADRAT